MSHEALELLKQALALPEKDRAELAGNLIDSLDNVVDEDVEAAWQEEVVRRAEELKSGRARPVSWNNVQQKAQRLLDGE